jgi:hypothetical protein
MRKFVALPLLMVIMFMASTLPGCQQETTPPSTPNTQSSISIQGNAKIYTNYKYGFSFSICDNTEFEVKENYKGTNFALLGPFLADQEQHIGVYVIISKLPKNSKFEDILESSRKESEEKLENFAITSEDTVTIDGIEAQRRSYTYTMTIGDMDYTFKNTLVIFMKDNNVYIIKYEVPEEYYTTFLDCFELLISTFKFL